ncbi:MAG TPA: DUF6427 family protein [Bacteroidia bacterium]|nr:DUF6427 family protein [Bacteroidia bacterium]
MLRILKSNPILLLALSIIMGIGIWVWVWISPAKDVNYTARMPLFNVFWGWATRLQVFSTGFGIILLLTQAFVWNAFVNSNTLLKQSSNFPAFFFILLASCRPSLICLYPALFASLFLVLAMRRLAASYKKEKALSEVFDAGLFIGIASLFYIPLAVFIVFLWIAILTIRSLIWREWVAALIGFVLPFGFALAYHYLFYTPELFWYDKLMMAINNYRKHWSFTWEEWLMLIAVVCVVIPSFWLFINKLSDNVVKAQKIWALMLWFVFFAMVSVVISPQRDARSLVVLALPVSFIFSNYFLKAKSSIWPEFLFLCLLITVGISLFF